MFTLNFVCLTMKLPIKKHCLLKQDLGSSPWELSAAWWLPPGLFHFTTQIAIILEASDCHWVSLFNPGKNQKQGIREVGREAYCSIGWGSASLRTHNSPVGNTKWCHDLFWSWSQWSSTWIMYLSTKPEEDTLLIHPNCNSKSLPSFPLCRFSSKYLQGSQCREENICL